MDEKLASNAKKEVLVELVKLAQKRGMRGSKGGWKEFLNVYDKKFGASLGDPSRRSVDALVAFLKTLDQDADKKFLEKVFECHLNRDVEQQHQKKSPDAETAEQRLVRLTLEHPRYPVEYSFPSHEEGWLVIKRRKRSKTLKSTAMIAVDCEMALCEDGTEALVRVSVVDRHLEVKLDELVNPNKAIADYRTDITGIAAKDLEGITCSLEDVQRSLRKLVSHGTIVVGHSLYNDLRALKVDHARVIDTSYVFKYENERPKQRPSLYNLCKSVLGFELRKVGSPHNSLDDAIAAMKLVLANIENGVDTVKPLPNEEVPEMDIAKLLIHRIPVSFPSNDLHTVLPGDFTLEVKAKKGGTYSALATFRSQSEANVAFGDLDGVQEKDSYGRPQKTIMFKHESGLTGELCVRKMADDSSLNNITSKKRSIGDEEVLSESKKKLKMTQMNVGGVGDTTEDCKLCELYLKDIENLKRELREREKEISNLNKIVVALTRKQGL